VNLSWRDVTRELYESEALGVTQPNYQMIAEHAGDLVCLLAIDGTVRWISPSADRVLGRPDAEVVGQNVNEYILADDHAKLVALRDRVVHDRLGESIEIRLRVKGGGKSHGGHGR
jgi:PAS domain S-box-containing protein